MGEGAEVGMSPFLTWKSTDALQVINSVGVSTSSGSKGEWSFGYIGKYTFFLVRLMSHVIATK